MNNSGIEISVATAADISGIIDLQERNLRQNGGALSVPFSAEWFAAAVLDMPIIVARRGGRIVGYLVSSPLAAQAHVSIVQAMMRAYAGAADAYNYGPVCVDNAERGRGVAAAMFRELRRRLPGREGITFIRRANTVSRAVHVKLGMREVVEFTDGGDAFVVLAYIG